MSPITKTRTARSDDWATPRWLFDHLDAEFHFTLDAAAQPWNAKCEHFIAPNEDALTAPWTGGSWGNVTVWLNPPYSVEKLRAFMRKAWEESRLGATVVCLVPCAPDTHWWAESVEGKAAEIRHLTRRTLPTGRVHFEREDGFSGRSGFASCLVIYRPQEVAAATEGSKAQ